MISIHLLSGVKIICQELVGLVSNEISFCLMLDQKIVWTISSELLDQLIYKEGQTLGISSGYQIAINEKKIHVETYMHDKIQSRITNVSIPVVDDRGVAVGVVCAAYPNRHPVVSAFDSFAPMLSHMFPEGVFIYLSDLVKNVKHQASEEFDLPNRHAGYVLQEGNIAKRSMMEKKTVFQEVDASRYGVPALTVNYPLYDEFIKDQVVGSFGFVIPKKTAGKLRLMSSHLDDSLKEISLVIQELANKSSEIHDKQLALAETINSINALSDEINKISAFIRNIADDTNLLGINASIEAARSGDAGRGFGVVATEIRKLSEQSKKSVPLIMEITNTIKSKVNETRIKSNDSIDFSRDQAAAAEEITASIDAIYMMTQELNAIAKKV